MTQEEDATLAFIRAKAMVTVTGVAESVFERYTKSTGKQYAKSALVSLEKAGLVKRVRVDSGRGYEVDVWSPVSEGAA